MIEVTITNFVILSLAVWRLSSLFANENGPFDMFKRFRFLCDKLCNNKPFSYSKINEGLKCEWCNSIWFSFALCFVLFKLSLFNSFVLPLAVSAVVIQIKYFREAVERSNRIPKIRKVSRKNEQSEVNYN